MQFFSEKTKKNHPEKTNVGKKGSFHSGKEMQFLWGKPTKPKPIRRTSGQLHSLRAGFPLLPYTFTIEISSECIQQISFVSSLVKKRSNSRGYTTEATLKQPTKITQITSRIVKSLCSKPSNLPN